MSVSTIANNIEKARLARGYTQAQVSSAIGVSRPTYANIESGKSEPTIRQAKILSSMLRVPIDDMLDLDDMLPATFNIVEVTNKYKQMILNAIKYGADDDGKITKTKLAKLVYLTDFIWYYINSTPLSGVTYRKLPQGPVADMYFRALDELEDEAMIVRDSKGKAILFSLIEKNAPTCWLPESALPLIKKICAWWKNKSTAEIVKFTHEQLPWQICRDGEVIPYDLITQEEPERVYGTIQL